MYWLSGIAISIVMITGTFVSYVQSEEEMITFSKNCTRKEQKLYTVMATRQTYYQYRTCKGVWFWERCFYRRRSRQETYRQSKIMYIEVATCCTGYIEDNSGNCTVGCPPGTFGEECQFNCTCPINAKTDCDKMTGSCTCLPGKTGKNCEKVCDEGWFGANCSYPCLCSDNQVCVHTSGECKCQAGKRGENCTEDCRNFTFGQDCSSNCSCVKDNTKQCTGTDGTCLCSPGWEGSRCQSTCNNAKYGQNCSLDCNCTKGFICEPVDGMCIPNCFCYQNGTLNCAPEGERCQCNGNFKQQACKAENITVITEVKGFLTTLCSCQDRDTFCIPQNNSCICRDGWYGQQCEKVIPQTSLQQSEIAGITTIVAGGLVGFAVLVTTAIFAVCYIRYRRNKDNLEKRNTGITYKNATYSTESQVLDSAIGISENTNASEYCLARSMENDDIQDMDDNMYQHIKRVTNADDKDVTSVYSRSFMGNIVSNESQESSYDLMIHDRSRLKRVDNEDYGILKTSICTSDDTYDLTSHNNQSHRHKNENYEHFVNS